MNRLKELRKERGLTQIQFAKEIKSAQSTVANWENGVRDIDSDRLQMLADYFNVSIDYILYRTNTPSKSHNSAFDGLDDDDIDMLKQMAQHLREKKGKKDGAS